MAACSEPPKLKSLHLVTSPLTTSLVSETPKPSPPRWNSSQVPQGTKSQRRWGEGWGGGYEAGCSFTSRRPGTHRREVGRAGTTRALRASSKQVSCRPASGSRPPPGSASGHRARGEGQGHLWPESASARSAGGGALPAPSHPRADPLVTQPGTGARGPRRPRRGQREARPHCRTRELGPLPAPARVRLPGVGSVGPVRRCRDRRGADPQHSGGEWAPALPASAPGPAGVAVPPTLPGPGQGETF